MAKCTFCGHNIEKGTGLLFVDLDGRTFNFCTRKCFKNQFKLKRKARNLKWTKYFAKHAKPAKKEKSRRAEAEETKK